MTFSQRIVFPGCLLLGAVLTIVAGTLHPDLRGDGAAQLTTIAQCEAWRAIHWGFLFSFPLALTGLVGLARLHAGIPGENAVRAGLIVGTFAYTAWMVIGSSAFAGCARALPRRTRARRGRGYRGSRRRKSPRRSRSRASAWPGLRSVSRPVSSGGACWMGRRCPAGWARAAWRRAPWPWGWRSSSAKTRRPTRRPSCFRYSGNC